MKDKILIGLLSELVLKNRNEEEQDIEFFRICNEWKDKGYYVQSGEGTKIDELWAVKK